MAARHGTCDRLRAKAESGDKRALGAARRLDCDWVDEIARAFADCVEKPVSFTTASGKDVAFTRRVGAGCVRRTWPTEKQIQSRERFAQAARGFCAPTDPACSFDRTRTAVITPQGSDRARYGLIESSELVASHDPMTFTPDARYPANVQEREYQFDANEQGKVARGAQSLNPAVLLHRSPTAVDGPPLVTEDGCALGGNGRTMMTKRAYREFPARAEAYRDALTCAAPDFGISSRDVRSMREPVLVRFIEGTRCDDNPTDLARAVRRYNEGLTQSIDVRALGVSQSRQLSPSTMNLFGQLVSGDRTLRDVMREDPRSILRTLEHDGVVTAQNRTRWVLPSGQLTDEGKDAIESMFVGRVLGSADRVRATAPGVMAKVEKAVPYLTAVAGRNPSFDLTKATQDAVDLVNRAQSSGASLEQSIQQRGMFDAPPSREAVELARMLIGLPPNAVRDRFKSWAREADFDPSQGMLGARPPTFEQAFQALTTAPRTGRAIGRGTVVNQERDPSKPARLAEVVAVSSRENPDIDPGMVRIRFLTGPMKGLDTVTQASSLGDVV